ncbi:MAG: protein-disulfide reductase DsbD [Rhodocyclaceae bacterium]|nr:MAG: protein-disulfide reductase DsbD [Rhodocyclaceae bacterium]
MLIRLFFSCLLLVAPWLAGAAQEPLPPEQAFQASAHMVDAHTAEASFVIAPGHYLYRKKFAFAVAKGGAQLGSPAFPASEIKDDPNFGKVEVYHQPMAVRLPVEGPLEGLQLKLSFQGCADQGICYPPLNQVVDVEPQGNSTATNVAGGEAGNETSRIAKLLHGNLALALVSFFGFGLLLSFTPCMLPMVPILSGIIVNHGHAVSHGRAFVLSLAYVLGMALTYALAGVAAGLSGTLLSSALQNAWVLGGFALVFVVLSLSMFGFYELQLPSSLQSKLSDTANHRGGNLPALFVMGVLSALIVGPCVAAPLAGALLYIAKTVNALLGGTALFAMALGMGLPLLAVGLFSRSLLPHTGPWMEAVKKFFGVLLLATALWLVSPVLPTWLLMLAWAALLIVPAIYLRAIDPLPHNAGNWQRFWKGVGILMLLAGAALAVGVAGGSRDPLKPLGFIGGPAAEARTVSFETVRTVAELDARLRNPGKPVLLDFYADWCVSCKEMERDTFSNPAVQQRFAQMTLLRADVTAANEADYALLKRFGLYGPPGIILFDKSGKELDDLRVVGYQPPEQFLAVFGRVPR